MFSTHIGSVQDEGSLIYLRPETAQGIYADFKSVVQSSRVKVPLALPRLEKLSVTK